MNQSFDISIICCTWNNAARLKITFDAMLSIDKPSDCHWELIVVDNNSSDDTQDVIRAYETQLPIKNIFEPKQGLSNARNSGLNSANGEFVIFIDDDIKPSNEWLTLYWSSFKQSQDRYFFGGPVESEFEDPNIDLDLIQHGPPSVKGFELDHPHGPDESIYAFLSANWGCKKNQIHEAGGFDPSLGLNPESKEVRVGEETQLMLNLKSRGLIPYYLPKASIKHWVPKSKVSLKHFAQRTKATAYHMTREEKQSSNDKMFKGAPLWAYKMVYVSYFKWLLSKVFRPLKYDQYIKSFWARGVIQAYQEGEK